ncbi:Zn-ribbon domain-containing OB-fold protein [Phreatobacter sp. AB_2022a]|uniref:Zn-ribbon domain-containing OB-fold protein n=1 Tax=Phreatobacter sp. AB_2022a TaxID=3003134 RepID=UPI002286D0C2|nr:OB-fold domain-containing protein [Phreatobacter sp. AB_2022a]MCZ0737880.1 OB-fold domain-containing protein [Phreatobacter sp. AB_2022a]
MTGLALSSCRSCGHAWQFPRAMCPACASTDVAALAASGRGTVWSATVVHRAPTPGLAVAGGYGIALVTLEEGPRIMARAPVDIRIGETVTVVVENGVAKLFRA